REFVDTVVQSCNVFEGNGRVTRYVGGYRDWAARGGSFGEDADKSEQKPAKAAPGTPAPQPSPAPGRAKLSYKLQRELERIPKDIETTERRIAELEREVADPAFYQKPHAETEPVFQALKAEQDKLETLFERWQELEAGG